MAEGRLLLQVVLNVRHGCASMSGVLEENLSWVSDVFQPQVFFVWNRVECSALLFPKLFHLWC